MLGDTRVVVPSRYLSNPLRLKILELRVYSVCLLQHIHSLFALRCLCAASKLLFWQHLQTRIASGLEKTCKVFTPTPASTKCIHVPCGSDSSSILNPYKRTLAHEIIADAPQASQH